MADAVTEGPTAGNPNRDWSPCGLIGCPFCGIPAEERDPELVARWGDALMRWASR